jgi:hypothetical protein
MVAGFAFSAAFYTAGAVYFGATAGTSYAYGRKAGRIICEKIDTLESNVTTYFTLKNEE